MAFQDVFHDPDGLGQLIVATQRALVEQFSEADWSQLAYETGTQDYVHGHDRLLRSLHWNDDDYPACVFQTLRWFSNQKPKALEAVVCHPKIRPVLERSVPDVLARLGLVEAHVPPVVSTTLSAPDVVARALRDADTLLATSGPVSCVDRLHTALHGYFRALAMHEQLGVADDASITALFKVLRTSHPKLAPAGLDADAGRVLNSFAAVIDALNTLRNTASVAHPNTDLLGTAEAHLMVNAVRTLFHYVREKLEGSSPEFPAAWRTF